MERIETIAASMGDGKFSRRDFLDASKATFPALSESSLSAMLQKAVKDGGVVRIERNRYRFANSDFSKRAYSHEYTDLAQVVAECLQSEFDGLDFRVFELVQLNEFLNHQISHNAVFAYVEKDLEDFAFDTLRDRFPGKVLFKPSEDDYQRYWGDGTIIVQRLVSESPRGAVQKWHTQPEKFVVDMLSDRLLRSLVPQSEVEDMARSITNTYSVNIPRLLRYARRRGVEDEVGKLVVDNNSHRSGKDS